MALPNRSDISKAVTVKPVADQAVRTSSMEALVQRVKDTYLGIYRWFSPGEPIAPVQAESQPRQTGITPGYNLIYAPRGEGLQSTTFEQLRFFSANYDVARICIQRRIEQMQQLEWKVVAKDGDDGKKYESQIKEAMEFFRKPDREHYFDQWLGSLLMDRLVCDAATLYPRPTRDGSLYALEYIDGASIKPLVDFRGKTPDYPAPAYQQILWGTPRGMWNAKELIYRPQNLRTYTPYGYSEIESILLIVNMALRKRYQDLAHWTDGNVPRSLMAVPQEWTADMIDQFQEMFDARMAGTPEMRARIVFVPGSGRGGIPIHEFTEFTGDPTFDEWLLKITCAALHVTPANIGFTNDVNKSTANSQDDITWRDGINPLVRFVQNLLDDVLSEYMQLPMLTFKFDIGDQDDKLQQAQVDKIYFDMGVTFADELRQQRLGLDALDIPRYVMIQGNPVSIDQLKAMLEAKPQDQPPQLPPGGRPQTEPPNDDLDQGGGNDQRPPASGGAEDGAQGTGAEVGATDGAEQTMQAVQKLYDGEIAEDSAADIEKAEDDEAGGHWITLHPGGGKGDESAEAEDSKSGGSYVHVFVRGGVIEKGPKGLVGKSLGKAVEEKKHEGPIQRADVPLESLTNGKNTFTKGKHAGKTLAQTYRDSPGYLAWYADPNGGNSTKAQEFLGSIPLHQAGKFQFDFGKHKGKTIEEVEKEAPDYLDWAMREFGRRDPRHSIIASHRSHRALQKLETMEPQKGKSKAEWLDDVENARNQLQKLPFLERGLGYSKLRNQMEMAEQDAEWQRKKSEDKARREAELEERRKNEPGFAEAEQHAKEHYARLNGRVAQKSADTPDCCSPVYSPYAHVSLEKAGGSGQGGDYNAVDIDWHQTFTDAKKSPELGEPRPGALDAIRAFIDAGLTIYFSCGGLGDEEGKDLEIRMRAWLNNHGIEPDANIQFRSKPRTLAVIDDRAICGSDPEWSWPKIQEEVLGRQEGTPDSDATKAAYQLARDDVRRWREQTRKLVKANMPPRTFRSEHIPLPLYDAVKNELGTIYAISQIDRSGKVTEIFTKALTVLNQAEKNELSKAARKDIPKASSGDGHWVTIDHHPVYINGKGQMLEHGPDSPVMDLDTDDGKKAVHEQIEPKVDDNGHDWHTVSSEKTGYVVDLRPVKGKTDRWELVMANAKGKDVQHKVITESSKDDALTVAHQMLTAAHVKELKNATKAPNQGKEAPGDKKTSQNTPQGQRGLKSQKTRHFDRDRYDGPLAKESVQKKVQKVVDDELAILAEHHETTPKELQTRIEGKLAGYAKASKVARWQPIADLAQILADNRFKNQMAVSSSRGTLDPDLRKECEARAFGLTKDAAWEQHPVYGFLLNGRESAYYTSSYGEVLVHFKDDAKKRSTMTVGDSLLNFENDEVMASPVLQPSYLSADLNANIVLDNDTMDDLVGTIDYLEVQIHGALTADDVAHMEFKPDHKPTDAIQSELKNRGITWSIYGQDGDK